MRHLLLSVIILFNILAFSAVNALDLDTRALHRLLGDQISTALQSASSTPLDKRGLTVLLGTLESKLNPQINHILDLKQSPLSLQDQDRLLDTLVVKVNGITTDWATTHLNPYVIKNHLNLRVLLLSFLGNFKRMLQEASPLRYRSLR